MSAYRILLPAVAALAFAGTAGAQPASPAPKPAPRVPASKPTPPPSPVLEGIVRGPDRKPIENALVIATRRPAGLSLVRPPARWVRTDADGRFRLSLLTQAPHAVRVESPGLAAATRRDVTAGTPLSFDLTAGGTIEGTVRDGDSGEPVADVRVVARPNDGIAVPEVPDAGRVVTRTDAKGRFKLQGLTSGPAALSAGARGHGAVVRGNVRTGSRVDLVLFPSGTIFGTVLGPDGRPVPGTTVTATTAWGDGATEPVDARGAYELLGLTAGDWRVVARAPGLAPAISAEVTIDRRSEVSVDLALRPGARIVGRVLAGDDRALAGTAALAEVDGRPVPRALVEPLSVAAGADGRFAIENVPVGAHALAASGPGHAGRRVDVTVRATDRQVDVGDVRLDAGLAIRGRVRSKAGQPIADAVVQAYGGEQDTEARSGADGTFLLAGLPPGEHQLHVEAAGYAAEEPKAVAGGPPIAIVLRPAGAITGRAVDERGQPVEGVRASADTGGDPSFTGEAKEPGTEDGRFGLANLAPGTYVLVVSAPERMAARVPVVQVAEGRTVDVGDVTLAAGAIVRGTVVDTSGAAVAGASLSAARNLLGSAALPSGGGPGELTSDASGAFELKGLAPGTVEIGATHPSYASSERVTVEVVPGKEIADVRVVMPVGGRIEGSVRKRDGRGHAGLFVGAAPAPGARILLTPSAFVSGRTADDGTFVLEHVPEGQVELTLSPGGGGILSASSTHTVDVRDGATTTVDIVERDILLSGRVTRSGGPGAGLVLRADGFRGGAIVGVRGPAPAGASEEPQRFAALTREDGSFEMLLDAPGRYAISAATVDGAAMLPARSIDVPDTEAFAVDLAYDSVTVTGVVVDEATDSPVANASIQARPRQGSPGTPSHARTGVDGRFALELEPAEYTLSADQRTGYLPAEVAASVGPSGLSNVRIELSKGGLISGVVRQQDGQPAVDVSVSAGGTAASSRRATSTRADGSFEIVGLADGVYTLTAVRADGAFASQRDVRTGGSARLSLRPGGRLTVTVKDATGTPVPGAWVGVSHVDGVVVGGGTIHDPTDAHGRTEIAAPLGTVTVTAGKVYGPASRRLFGTASVTVQPSQTAAVEIQLKPGEP
jgi:protocatechuate 3,4-dioxygenase beta subunit